MVVVATLAAPLTAGAALLVVESSASPLESDTPVAPLIASVESATRSRDTIVGVTLSTSAPVVATTDASGTVTTLPIAPGAQVDTGTVVATVGDADLVAYRSARPLSQDVGSGSTGASIGVAQAFLRDTGHFGGPVDGVVRTSTLRAITAFNKEHGYGTSQVLTRASLVWLGPDPLTVAKVDVTVGADVSPGTAVLTSTAGNAGVTVARMPPLPEGTLELEIDGKVAPFDRQTASATDPQFVGEVGTFLSSVTEATGVLRLAEPVVVGTVPSSAVVTDESGSVCLFPGVDDAPVVVEPTGGSLGTVDVDPALTGSPVLVNPREVRTDLSCEG